MLEKVAFFSIKPREWDTLLLSFKGLSVTQAGQQLHLSPKTVSTYRTRCMEKLGRQVNNDCLLPCYGLWTAGTAKFAPIAANLVMHKKCKIRPKRRAQTDKHAASP